MKKTMTKEEKTQRVARFMLYYRGLGYDTFAEMASDLKVHRSTISAWVHLKNPIPDHVFKLLEYMTEEKKERIVDKINKKEKTKNYT